MKIAIAASLCLLVLSACTSSKRTAIAGATVPASGDTRTKEVAYLDNNTYKLEELATDKAYGYEQSNPIKVGGARDMSGPLNERKFLNGLAGPNGEAIGYYRTGSCCGFKTPNGFDNIGLLDRYKVYWKGCKDTAILYINMYDKGDLKVPVGFRAKE